MCHLDFSGYVRHRNFLSAIDCEVLGVNPLPRRRNLGPDPCGVNYEVA